MLVLMGLQLENLIQNGQRGAITSDVIFENCEASEEALLGNKEGIGFKTAMKVLDRGRLHISAICVDCRKIIARISKLFNK